MPGSARMPGAAPLPGAASLPDAARMLDVAIALAQAAGSTLMDGFGGPQSVSKKGDDSNVVTAADGRAERLIVDGLRTHFPSHAIVAEEGSGSLRASDWCWVIDPLDGTSNYAAGIPWFGVLIAALHEGVPKVAVMHLPALGDTYVAQAGAGARRNGRPIAVTGAASLGDVLWAYGMDIVDDPARQQREVQALARLAGRVRNVRATNSLLDAAMTADGRLGGVLNWSCKVWDIAAPMLVVAEAGGAFTAVDGSTLVLDIGPDAAERDYAVLAGAPMLHREALALVGGASR